MQDPEEGAASLRKTEGCTHVLLITTGSVASIKAPLIVAELLSVRSFFVFDPTTRESSPADNQDPVSEREGGGGVY